MPCRLRSGYSELSIHIVLYYLKFTESMYLSLQRGSDSMTREGTASLPKVATPRKPSVKDNDLDLSRWDNWPNCNSSEALISQEAGSDEAAPKFASSGTVEYCRAFKDETQHSPFPGPLKAEVKLFHTNYTSNHRDLVLLP